MAAKVGHRDPVTPEVYEHVRRRDGWCVGARIGMPGVCSWHLELDHIDGGGLSRRGPSTPDNLVLLCSAHHRVKTEAARTWRPPLRDWVRLMEDRHA